jgi:N-acetyl-anhydromuramyl-L-alanine amidase AmpD
VLQTDVIVMDFAKAFDKIPHKRLLYKLKYYGADTNTPETMLQVVKVVVAFKMFHEITSYDVLHDFTEYTG